jgi:hypothetical protein
VSQKLPDRFILPFVQGVGDKLEAVDSCTINIDVHRFNTSSIEQADHELPVIDDSRSIETHEY